MDHPGLYWWIIWDLLERAKGKMLDKNQQQLISNRILKIRDIHLTCLSSAQLQILLLSTAKENTHEGLVVSLKTSKKHELLYFIFENNSMLCYCCSNASVCILIEGDNILRVWPLETENFKLGSFTPPTLYTSFAYVSQASYIATEAQFLLF